MKLSELLLPEWDEEMAATRKTLERVPDSKPDWKPHPKSMTLGNLAFLIASMPGWCTSIVEQDFIDLAAGGYPKTIPNRQELLQIFDRNAAQGRAAIARASDAALEKSWSLKMGPRVLMTQKKREALRSSVNHMVHHRAQMGVYLRLNDIPVPSIYGPTADEKTFG